MHQISSTLWCQFRVSHQYNPSSLFKQTDVLLQGQRNDGATEEIASTFKLVASKHAWGFSETTQPTQRRVPRWSYCNSYPRQWSQGHSGDKNWILVNWQIQSPHGPADPRTYSILHLGRSTAVKFRHLSADECVQPPG